MKKHSQMTDKRKPRKMDKGQQKRQSPAMKATHLEDLIRPQRTTSSVSEQSLEPSEDPRKGQVQPLTQWDVPIPHPDEEQVSSSQESIDKEELQNIRQRNALLLKEPDDPASQLLSHYDVELEYTLADLMTRMEERSLKKYCRIADFKPQGTLEQLQNYFARQNPLQQMFQQQVRHRQDRQLHPDTFDDAVKRAPRIDGVNENQGSIHILGIHQSDTQFSSLITLLQKDGNRMRTDMTKPDFLVDMWTHLTQLKEFSLNNSYEPTAILVENDQEPGEEMPKYINDDEYNSKSIHFMLIQLEWPNVRIFVRNKEERWEEQTISFHISCSKHKKAATDLESQLLGCTKCRYCTRLNEQYDFITVHKVAQSIPESQKRTPMLRKDQQVDKTLSLLPTDGISRQTFDEVKSLWIDSEHSKLDSNQVEELRKMDICNVIRMAKYMFGQNSGGVIVVAPILKRANRESMEEQETSYLMYYVSSTELTTKNVIRLAQDQLSTEFVETEVVVPANLEGVVDFIQQDLDRNEVDKEEIQIVMAAISIPAYGQQVLLNVAEQITELLGVHGKNIYRLDSLSNITPLQSCSHVATTAYNVNTCQKVSDMFIRFVDMKTGDELDNQKEYPAAHFSETTIHLAEALMISPVTDEQAVQNLFQDISNEVAQVRAQEREAAHLQNTLLADIKTYKEVVVISENNDETSKLKSENTSNRVKAEEKAQIEEKKEEGEASPPHHSTKEQIQQSPNLNAKEQQSEKTGDSNVIPGTVQSMTTGPSTEKHLTASQISSNPQHTVEQKAELQPVKAENPKTSGSRARDSKGVQEQTGVAKVKQDPSELKENETMQISTTGKTGTDRQSQQAAEPVLNPSGKDVQNVESQLPQGNSGPYFVLDQHKNQRNIVVKMIQIRRMLQLHRVKLSDQHLREMYMEKVQDPIKFKNRRGNDKLTRWKWISTQKRCPPLTYAWRYITETERETWYEALEGDHGTSSKVYYMEEDETEKEEDEFVRNAIQKLMSEKGIRIVFDPADRDPPRTCIIKRERESKFPWRLTEEAAQDAGEENLQNILHEALDEAAEETDAKQKLLDYRSFTKIDTATDIIRRALRPKQAWRNQEEQFRRRDKVEILEEGAQVTLAHLTLPTRSKEQQKILDPFEKSDYMQVKVDHPEQIMQSYYHQFNSQILKNHDTLKQMSESRRAEIRSEFLKLYAEVSNRQMTVEETKSFDERFLESLQQQIRLREKLKEGQLLYNPMQINTETILMMDAHKPLVETIKARRPGFTSIYQTLRPDVNVIKHIKMQDADKLKIVLRNKREAEIEGQVLEEKQQRAVNNIVQQTKKKALKKKLEQEARPIIAKTEASLKQKSSEDKNLHQQPIQQEESKEILDQSKEDDSQMGKDLKHVQADDGQSQSQKPHSAAQRQEHPSSDVDQQKNQKAQGQQPSRLRDIKSSQILQTGVTAQKPGARAITLQKQKIQKSQKKQDEDYSKHCKGINDQNAAVSFYSQADSQEQAKTMYLQQYQPTSKFEMEVNLKILYTRILELDKALNRLNEESEQQEDRMQTRSDTTIMYKVIDQRLVEISKEKRDLMDGMNILTSRAVQIASNTVDSKYETIMENFSGKQRNQIIAILKRRLTNDLNLEFSKETMEVLQQRFQLSQQSTSAQKIAPQNEQTRIVSDQNRGRSQQYQADSHPVTVLEAVISTEAASKADTVAPQTSNRQQAETINLISQEDKEMAAPEKDKGRAEKINDKYHLVIEKENVWTLQVDGVVVYSDQDLTLDTETQEGLRNLNGNIEEICRDCEKYAQIFQPEVGQVIKFNTGCSPINTLLLALYPKTDENLSVTQTAKKMKETMEKIFEAANAIGCKALGIPIRKMECFPQDQDRSLGLIFNVIAEYLKKGNKNDTLTKIRLVAKDSQQFQVLNKMYDERFLYGTFQSTHLDLDEVMVDLSQQAAEVRHKKSKTSKKNLSSSPQLLSAAGSSDRSPRSGSSKIPRKERASSMKALLQQAAPRTIKEQTLQITQMYGSINDQLADALYEEYKQNASPDAPKWEEFEKYVVQTILNEAELEEAQEQLFQENQTTVPDAYKIAKQEKRERKKYEDEGLSNEQIRAIRQMQSAQKTAAAEIGYTVRRTVNVSNKDEQRQQQQLQQEQQNQAAIEKWQNEGGARDSVVQKGLQSQQSRQDQAESHVTWESLHPKTKRDKADLNANRGERVMRNAQLFYTLIKSRDMQPNSSAIRSLTTINGVTIQVAKGNIKTETTDAVVNGANTGLTLGEGLAGAIRECDTDGRVKIACAKILEKYPPNKGVPVGSAHLTPAAKDMKCHYIIHAVAPKLQELPTMEEILRKKPKLEMALEETLKLAQKSNIKSLSLSAIGSGEFHYPIKRARITYFEQIEKFICELAQTDTPPATLTIRLLNKDDKTVTEMIEEFDTRYGNLLIQATRPQEEGKNQPQRPQDRQRSPNELEEEKFPEPINPGQIILSSEEDASMNDETNQRQKPEPQHVDFSSTIPNQGQQPLMIAKDVMEKPLQPINKAKDEDSDSRVSRQSDQHIDHESLIDVKQEEADKQQQPIVKKEEMLSNVKQEGATKKELNEMSGSNKKRRKILDQDRAYQSRIKNFNCAYCGQNKTGQPFSYYDQQTKSFSKEPEKKSCRECHLRFAVHSPNPIALNRPPQKRARESGSPSKKQIEDTTVSKRQKTDKQTIPLPDGPKCFECGRKFGKNEQAWHAMGAFKCAKCYKEDKFPDAKFVKAVEFHNKLRQVASNMEQIIEQDKQKQQEQIQELANLTKTQVLDHLCKEIKHRNALLNDADIRRQGMEELKQDLSFEQIDAVLREFAWRQVQASEGMGSLYDYGALQTPPANLTKDLYLKLRELLKRAQIPKKIAQQVQDLQNQAKDLKLRAQERANDPFLRRLDGVEIQETEQGLTSLKRQILLTELTAKVERDLLNEWQSSNYGSIGSTPVQANKTLVDQQPVSSASPNQKQRDRIKEEAPDFSDGKINLVQESLPMVFSQQRTNVINAAQNNQAKNLQKKTSLSIDRSDLAENSVLSIAKTQKLCQKCKEDTSTCGCSEVFAYLRNKWDQYRAKDLLLTAAMKKAYNKSKLQEDKQFVQLRKEVAKQGDVKYRSSNTYMKQFNKGSAAIKDGKQLPNGDGQIVLSKSPKVHQLLPDLKEIRASNKSGYRVIELNTLINNLAEHLKQYNDTAKDELEITKEEIRRLRRGEHKTLIMGNKPAMRKIQENIVQNWGLILTNTTDDDLCKVVNNIITDSKRLEEDKTRKPLNQTLFYTWQIYERLLFTARIMTENYHTSLGKSRQVIDSKDVDHQNFMAYTKIMMSYKRAVAPYVPHFSGEQDMPDKRTFSLSKLMAYLVPDNQSLHISGTPMKILEIPQTLAYHSFNLDLIQDNLVQKQPKERVKQHAIWEINDIGIGIQSDQKVPQIMVAVKIVPSPEEMKEWQEKIKDKLPEFTNTHMTNLARQVNEALESSQKSQGAAEVEIHPQIKGRQDERDVNLRLKRSMNEYLTPLKGILKASSNIEPIMDLINMQAIPEVVPILTSIIEKMTRICSQTHKDRNHPRAAAKFISLLRDNHNLKEDPSAIEELDLLIRRLAALEAVNTPMDPQSKKLKQIVDDPYDYAMRQALQDWRSNYSEAKWLDHITYGKNTNNKNHPFMANVYGDDEHNDGDPIFQSFMDTSHKKISVEHEAAEWLDAINVWSGKRTFNTVEDAILSLYTIKPLEETANGLNMNKGPSLFTAPLITVVEGDYVGRVKFSVWMQTDGTLMERCKRDYQQFIQILNAMPAQRVIGEVTYKYEATKSKSQIIYPFIYNWENGWHTKLPHMDGILKLGENLDVHQYILKDALRILWYVPRWTQNQEKDQTEELSKKKIGIVQEAYYHMKHSTGPQLNNLDILQKLTKPNDDASVETVHSDPDVTQIQRVDHIWRRLAKHRGHRVHEALPAWNEIEYPLTMQNYVAILSENIRGQKTYEELTIKEANDLFDVIEQNQLKPVAEAIEECAAHWDAHHKLVIEQERAAMDTEQANKQEVVVLDTEMEEVEQQAAEISAKEKLLQIWKTAQTSQQRQRLLELQMETPQPELIKKQESEEGHN